MARGAIANLAVSVTARTSDFRKGMRTVREDTRRTKQSFRNLLGDLKTSTVAWTALGVAVVGATKRLFAATRQTQRFIDTIGKASTKLGITVQTLSALEHVANLSGVSFQTLQMALQRMVRRVAEAAANMGEARGALKELGLQAKQLNMMPFRDMLAEVADALAEVKNQGDRVRLFMKLVDSEGVAALPAFQEGSQALRDMMKEAERLGIVLDKNLVRKTEDVNDAWTRAGAAWKGVWIDFVDWITPASNALAKLVELTGSLIFKLNELRVRHIEELARITAKFTRGMMIGFEPNVKGPLGAGITHDIGGLEVVGPRIKRAEPAYKPRGILAGHTPRQSGRGPAIVRPARAVAEYTKQIDSLNSSFSRSNDLRAFAETMKALTQTPLQRLRETMRQIMAASRAGYMTYAGAQKAISYALGEFMETKAAGIAAKPLATRAASGPMSFGLQSIHAYGGSGGLGGIGRAIGAHRSPEVKELQSIDGHLQRIERAITTGGLGMIAN